MGNLMKHAAYPLQSLIWLAFLTALMPVPGSAQGLESTGQGMVLSFGDEEPPVLIQPGQMTDTLVPNCTVAPQVSPETQTVWGSGVQRGPWHWQFLPDGLTYPAYLASGRESRMGGVWSYEKDHGWLWDIALGAHVGILRYGDDDPELPHGWQLDIEGAAFPRLDLEATREMIATDFRFGVPLSVRQGPFETKLAYYHLSSHLGDDYIFANPGHLPVNYTRDVVVWAVGVRVVENFRMYAEAGYAIHRNGGSKPWEFQFGIDWSHARQDSFFGSPFFAVNGRIREEVDYGGNLTAQTGWQWRGDSGNLLRFGLEYFNGKSDSYQFFTEHEEHFGVGLWYDF